jgi:hypothetical protein
MALGCGGGESDPSGSGGGSTGGSTATGMPTSSSSSGNGAGPGSGGCTPAPMGCYDYCEFDKESGVSFEDDVIPIFEAHCNSSTCHGNISTPDGDLYLGESSNTSADEMIEVYGELSEFSQQALELKRVDAFDPEISWLMIKLDSDMTCPNSTCVTQCGQRMPRGSGAQPLSDAELTTIRSWIVDGASGP